MQVDSKNAPVARAPIFIPFLVFAGLSVLLLACVTWEIGADSLVYPVSVLVVAECVWCVWSWRCVAGNLFNPYFLFLSAASFSTRGRYFWKF